MNMRLLVAISLIFFHGRLLAEDVSSSKPSGTSCNIVQVSSDKWGPDSNKISSDKDVTNASENFIIHYGLNDSHSRSWVQENNDGVVGITYFQRFEGNYTEGNLLYKTILPDGSTCVDTVTTGVRLEKSVLLYDAESGPHIFVARSNDLDQVIDHYYRNESDYWESETIIHFNGAGGKFIYELSADTGPGQTFHLLILKTRSNIDSNDFLNAWLNSHLYYLTNASGEWELELVHNYNMAWTYDMYVKSSGRQDIKVDDDGFVHATFSEQIASGDYPSRLMYTTNKTGDWHREVVMSYLYGSRDDAGWYPSLCLDNTGVPHISCMYVHRYVGGGSAIYSKLFFLKRRSPDNWRSQVVADHDDGYYGSDGRNYTGGLTHLVFDENNTPHIIFSDIASSHYAYRRLNVGNIRYAVFADGLWNLSTIYHQPRPSSFFNAIEMYGMCLKVSTITDTLRIIGVELKVTGEYQYTCSLLDFAWAPDPPDPTDVGDVQESLSPKQYYLSQNHPNPFNPLTTIDFSLPRRSWVTVSVYNLLGEQVAAMVNKQLSEGYHSLEWDGTDQAGNKVSSGIYFYRIRAGDFMETKKMLLLK